MFNHGKLCSYICLSVYMLLSTNCAPWLIEKSGRLIFGVINNEYPCQGSNCGCDSAYKCLTACCCVQDLVPDSSEQNCCIEVPVEVESCCSEIELPLTEIFFEAGGCSADLVELLQGSLLHLSFISLNPSEQSFRNDRGLSERETFYDFDNKHKLLKVPLKLS